jgi:hypothetical protein
MTVLDDIYNAFDPAPLPAGSPVYVNCNAVRGNSDVLISLGKKVVRSRKPTCQLFTGHRGGGKSTELLRLQADLETKGCTVVYFSAEDEDVNTEDVEYTDILLACTRHLLERVKEADRTPIASWLKERAKEIDDILKTNIRLSDAQFEIGVKEFAKVTAAIRTQPTQRAKLRELLTPYTDKLVDALNLFIADAKAKLPPERNNLVVIADGLEKVTPILRDNGRTNHDEIFVDRSEQLKGLNCHVIYTVPISMALSSRASDLMEIYNCALQVLPMVMVQTRDNQPQPAGIAALTEIVRQRVHSIPKAQGMALEAEVFDSPETLAQLCQTTGGHVRNLVFLVQTAIDYNNDRLPIQATALQQSIRQLRKTFRDTVNDDQWPLLVRVHRSKRILNDDAHRSLLFTRCLLEYEDGDCEKWHDVHPVLRDVPEFREALANLPHD